MFPSISRDNWTRSREKLRGWRRLGIRRRWRRYRVVQHSRWCGHRRLRVSWWGKSHRRRSQRSWRGGRKRKWFLRLWARLFFVKKFINFIYRKIRSKSRTFGDSTLKGRLGVALDDFGVWILVGEVNGGNGLRGYLMAYTASKTL